jgi:hypothetical protein
MKKKKGWGDGRGGKGGAWGQKPPALPVLPETQRNQWRGLARAGGLRAVQGRRASAWPGGAEHHRHGHGQYGVALHPVGCEPHPVLHTPGRALVAVLISLAGWRRSPPPWSWADAESLHIAGDFRAGIRSKAEIVETRTAKGVPAKNVPPVCPRKKCAPRGMSGRVLTH